LIENAKPRNRESAKRSWKLFFTVSFAFSSFRAFAFSVASFSLSPCLRGEIAFPALLLAASMALGCRSGAAPPSRGSATAGAFVDVTEAAGVRFRHTNGGSGKKYMPETMGSGCAFLDVDGDNRLDLFLVNSRPLDSAPSAQRPAPVPALYRNNGDGTFTDITAGSGLDVPLFGMGCAVGDYDNDGRDDLYVTCALDTCRLFRNEGGGNGGGPGGRPIDVRFRDVTATAGVGNAGRWGTSAAWLDYDRDGHLDLFVCNYLKYDLAHDIFCGNRLGQKSYCTPRHYEGLPSTLYHNEGNGAFRDVSQATGIAAHSGKGLGIAVWDVERDGWPDLYVANDTTPNHLFRYVPGRRTTNDQRPTTPDSSNVGRSSLVVGRFQEIGTESGVAFGENGLARAGMGVDVAPMGPKGERAILVANFTNEPISFFWEEGKSFFTERTTAAGLSRGTLLTLGFGAFFFDYDNDGAPDIFIANGHVQDDIHLFQANLSYAQPHQLYRNMGEATFSEITSAAGPPFTVLKVSRGAAHGDYDNDGDLDLLVNNNNALCELLRNEGGNQKHWLQLKLVGSAGSDPRQRVPTNDQQNSRNVGRSSELVVVGRPSNRSAIGAEVRVTAGDRVLRDRVRSGSSYCSASMLRLHFGLGDRAQYDAIEVTWPGGRTERFPGGPADRMVTLTEGHARPR
jgi:hypothetical protein